tara:strand:- start:2705 stop:3883 length:1179 start_codon:yes stop_codon:yes gene_type:complete
MVFLKKSLSIISLLLVFVLTACEKESNDNPSSSNTASCTDGIQNGDETGIDCGGSNCAACTIAGAPTVITGNASQITYEEAFVSAEVSHQGDSSVLSRGIVYSTSSNPTLADARAYAGSGLGAFSIRLNSLNENTTYFARAFASNSIGTSYGNEIQFTTATAPPNIVVSAWIEPANGYLYACSSYGVIKRKTSYTSNYWSLVDDDASFPGNNLQSVWIEPANGYLYGVGADGTIRSKTSYTSNYWSLVDDDATFYGENLRCAWIEPANGYLYAVGADGTIRRKTSYTSNYWSLVDDDATFYGENLSSAWIEPANGYLYAVGTDGTIRRKTSYTSNYWSLVDDDANFSENNLQSVWIEPANGYLYGVGAEGIIRRKTSYTSNYWSLVDDDAIF